MPAPAPAPAVEREVAATHMRLAKFHHFFNSVDLSREKELDREVSENTIDSTDEPPPMLVAIRPIDTASLLSVA